MPSTAAWPMPSHDEHVSIFMTSNALKVVNIRWQPLDSPLCLDASRGYTCIVCSEWYHSRTYSWEVTNECYKTCFLPTPTVRTASEALSTHVGSAQRLAGALNWRRTCRHEAFWFLGALSFVALALSHFQIGRKQVKGLVRTEDKNATASSAMRGSCPSPSGQSGQSVLRHGARRDVEHGIVVIRAEGYRC
jgi:hypothetical protein